MICWCSTLSVHKYIDWYSVAHGSMPVVECEWMQRLRIEAFLVSSRFVLAPCVRYDYNSFCCSMKCWWFCDKKNLLCCYAARDMHFSALVGHAILFSIIGYRLVLYIACTMCFIVCMYLHVHCGSLHVVGMLCQMWLFVMLSCCLFSFCLYLLLACLECLQCYFC